MLISWHSRNLSSISMMVLTCINFVHHPFVNIAKVVEFSFHQTARCRLYQNEIQQRNSTTKFNMVYCQHFSCHFHFWSIDIFWKIAESPRWWKKFVIILCCGEPDVTAFLGRFCFCCGVLHRLPHVQLVLLLAWRENRAPSDVFLPLSELGLASMGESYDMRITGLCCLAVFLSSVPADRPAGARNRAHLRCR